MTDAFYIDASNKSNNRIRKWYQNNLMPTLLAAKSREAREIDASIAIAKELIQILEEPRVKCAPSPVYEVKPSENDDYMKPIEPEVLNILHGSTEKGAKERYLTARYKKLPENRFNFRLSTNWDYGWQQNLRRAPARDVNRGRCAILRDTFYRKNNLAPDPKHYSQPAGGAFSICSEYSCSFH